MKLGAYTAVLHDRPLPEALAPGGLRCAAAALFEASGRSEMSMTQGGR